MLLLGATAAVAGVVLWPPSDTGAPRVALLPSLSGFALAGAW
jgi:hypothetical protein